MPSSFDNLRNNLRELRERHGLTQEEAAQLCGLSYKHYQAIESGRKKQIWLETVDRLAQGFGLKGNEILQITVPEVGPISAKPPPSRVHNKRTKR